MTRVGPAGNSESFAAQGHKSSAEIPEYLSKMGLDAYEYQCGHGVRVSEGLCRALGEAARQRDIALSLHAPYYISLASPEEEKREASVRYLLQSARAADWMGAGRIVLHPGSCAGLSRGEALGRAKQTLRLALDALCGAGYGGILLCPETMGKPGQLGTLEEVLELCAMDERLYPCIDFGHLYARSFGAFQGREAFAAMLCKMERELGAERALCFHAHFSRIEFTEKGGEKRHLTFADTSFGPDFLPLAELIAERGLSPVLICESAGTQAEDAAQMKRMLREQAVKGGKARE